MFSRYYFFWLFLLLLLSGCAGNFQDGRELSYDESLLAGKCLRKVSDHSQISFLDADYKLGWQRYGSKQTIPLSVQISDKGKVRFTGFDPLGRPFFIFVSDDKEFTLVDSRNGKVYSGLQSSAFVRDYIPSVLSFARLFLLLTGQLPDSKPEKISVPMGKDSVYRFRFNLDGTDSLVIDVDCGQEKMLQQVLFNDDSVEVIYNNFHFTDPEQKVPPSLKIKSSELYGEATLVLEKVYGYDMVNKDFFLLSIPPHFERIEVK